MQTLLPTIEKVYRDSGSGGWGYSYLLRRPQGNLFLARMARTAAITGEYAAIEAAGGIAKIYITDNHFSGPNCEAVSRQFGAPILYPEKEHPKLAARGFSNAGTFPNTRHFVEPDLEVIPTPGHTAGGVCFLWHSPQGRMLFSGDFLYNSGPAWVVGSKTLSKVRGSLELIRDLEFEVLVGCGDEELGVPYLEMSPEQRRIFIDGLIENLEP
jgi:hypothetical protein